MNPQDTPPTSPFGRLLLAAVVVAVIVLGFVLLPVDEWLDRAAEWNKAHPIGGALLYLAFATLGSVLFTPGSVIAMSAGYIYGFATGSVLSVIGMSAGALAAFLCGRLLVRDWVFSRLDEHPRLRALDRAVYDNSFVLVALTRLSLVIPFNLLNYVYGVTGVKKVPYVLGTAIGTIPASVLWTYAGTLARNFEDIRSGNLESGLPGRYVLMVGFVMIIIIVVFVHRAASRALSERLGE